MYEELENEASSALSHTSKILKNAELGRVPSDEQSKTWPRQSAELGAHILVHFLLSARLFP